MRKDTCKAHISLTLKCKCTSFSFRLENIHREGIDFFCLTLGGLKGYSAGKTMSIKKAPWKKTNKPQFASDKMGCGRFFGIMTLLYGAESGTNKPCHTNRLDSSTYTKSDLKPKPIPKITWMSLKDLPAAFLRSPSSFCSLLVAAILLCNSVQLSENQNLRESTSFQLSRAIEVNIQRCFQSRVQA